MKKNKLFLVIIGLFAMSQFAFAQPGSTFTDPVIVNSLPLIETGESTCGFGDNYTTLDIACLGNFMSGDEKIYSFTPASNMFNIEVAISNISDNFSGLFVTDDSTNAGNCMGSVTGTGSVTRTISGLSLTGGTTYYIIVSSWANPQCVGSYDLRIVDQTCPAPDSLMVVNVQGTSADFMWAEMGAATQWEVEYDVTGFTPGTGNTMLTTSIPFSVTTLMPTTTYDFYVRAVCTATDSSYLVGPVTFTTPCAPIVAPHTESFDVPSMPNCWSQTAQQGGPWQFTGTPGYGASGAQDHTGNNGEFIWMDFSGTDVAVSLVTADFDVSALTTPFLEFYFYTNNTNNAAINDLIVESWDGANWNTVDSIHQNIGGWAKFGANLSSHTFGTDLVRLRFRAERTTVPSAFNQDFLLDDITIMEVPTCPEPGSLAALPTGFSADVSWIENGSATNWEVEYGAPGFVQGSAGGTLMATATNPTTIPGLTVVTDYEFYVRSVCGAGDTSLWVGPFAFTTTPSCPQPTSLSANVSPSTTVLSWVEAGSPLMWEYEYGSAGFTLGTGTNDTSSVDTVLLTGLAASASFSYYVRSICSPGDSSSWSGPFNFATPCAAVMAPYTESFDVNGTPNCWTQAATTGGPWVFAGNPGYGAAGTQDHTGNGGRFAWMDFSGTDAAVRITTMDIDVTNLTVPFLQFYYFSNNTNDATLNELIVEAWDGTAWVSIDTIAQNTGAWTEFGYDITAFTFGSNLVKIQFRAEPGAGTPFYHDLLIDDVSVLEAPTCLAPSGLVATNVAGTTADFGWTPNGTGTQWKVEYGLLGFTQGTGDTVLTTNNPVTLTGLTPSSDYQIYVQSVCGPGDTSLWTGPLVISTACATVLAPYTQSFDLPVTPNCWTQSAIQGGPWRFGGTPGYGAANAQDHTGNGGEFIWMDFSIPDEAVALTTLTIDVSNLTVPLLEFYFYTNNTNDASINDLIVEAWDGADWVTIDSIHQNLGAWTEFSYVLSSYTYGADLVQIQFRAEDGGGTQFYQDFLLDDVSVIEAPTCPKTSNLNMSNATQTSADFGWTEQGSATQWEVEYDIAGFTLGTGTNSGVITTNPYPVSGLTPNTGYDFYVRAICGPGDTSLWSTPLSFFTGYCTPAPTSVDGIGITNVSMDTVNNTTGAETGNYGDYSNLIAVAEQASTLDIDITLQAGPTYDLWAWIDWNNDLDFNDAGEAYYLGTSLAANPTTLSASIAIPFASPLGNHRIRIGGADFGLGTTLPADPCYTGSWATFEDYTLLIVIPTSCIAVDSLEVTNLTANSFDLGWVDYNPATLWEILYDDSIGFIPGSGTGTSLTTTTNPHSFTALTSNTGYDFYVRAICSIGDTSGWTGPFSVTTPCDVISTFPFTEGFDLTSPTLGCWRNNYLVGVGNWGVASGALGGVITAPFFGAYNLVYVNPGGVNSPITNAVSPTFDLTGLTAPRVHFYYAQEEWFGDQNYTRLLYRAASSDPWTEIWSDSTNVDVWTKVTVQLPNPSATYELAFQGINNNGRRNVVDEMTVEDTPANDLSVTSVSTVGGFCGLGMDSIKAVIVNNGSADQTGFTIGYTFDGVAITPETVSATVPAFGTYEYTFTTMANFAVPGDLDIEAYTLLATDVNTSNDTAMEELSKTYLISSFPYLEDFAAGEEGWVIDNTNNGSWAFGTPAQNTIQGASSDTNAFVIGGLSGGYNANEYSFVSSPCFDFSSLQRPLVQVDVWWEAEWSWDGGQIQYSTDGGAVWNMLGDVGDGFNWYNDNTINGFNNAGAPQSGWTGRNGTGNTGGSNGWRTATIEADVLAGMSSVNFRVAFASDGSVQDEGFAFDNFSIFDAASLGNDTVLCTNDTLTLSPGTYEGYLWSDSSITPIQYLDAAIMAEGTDTINVIVAATGGYKMYDTIVVTVEKPTVSLGTDTVVCYGESVILSADTGFASYVWNDNSTMQTLTTDGSVVGGTDYSVLVLTANNCPATDTVNVNVNTQVLVDLGIDTIFSDSTTQGTSYLLDAGPGFASYLWSDGSTGQTYLVGPTNDENISVVVTNSGGCEGSDTVFVDFRLGVNSLEVSQITMYPNPTTDIITIEVSNFTSLGDVNINILDITGKVVMTEQLNGGGATFKETYDVSKLATGTYFVQFEANGEVQTRQFIIK